LGSASQTPMGAMGGSLSGSKRSSRQQTPVAGGRRSAQQTPMSSRTPLGRMASSGKPIYTPQATPISRAGSVRSIGGRSSSALSSSNAPSPKNVGGR
jgi:hypothetical protein